MLSIKIKRSSEISKRDIIIPLLSGFIISLLFYYISHYEFNRAVYLGLLMTAIRLTMNFVRLRWVKR